MISQIFRGHKYRCRIDIGKVDIGSALLGIKFSVPQGKNLIIFWYFLVYNCWYLVFFGIPDIYASISIGFSKYVRFLQRTMLWQDVCLSVRP